MVNLEIKISVQNPHDFYEKIKNIISHSGEVLLQTDTYYLVGKKRLKLREEQHKSYFVFYIRPDVAQSKYSKYYIVPVPQKAVKYSKYVCAKILGAKICVDKKRTLFMYKNTRIHFDEVKNLGTFIELETVCADNQAQEDLKNEHYCVIESLSLDMSKSVKESYSDLLLAHKLICT